MKNFLRILRCPYCNFGFKQTSTFLKNQNLKIIKCRCGEYPIIDNLVILIKNDSLLNKKLIKAIRKKNIYVVIWKLLLSESIGVRCIIFTAFLIYRKFNIKISLEKLLSLLNLLNVNKKWFTYLINRERAEDFNFAYKIFKDESGKVLVDLGCGAGQFIKKIKKFNRYDFIVGLDKVVSSLIIANLYSENRSVIFILCDLEQGIPLQNSVASTAIYLNSLPWIYNKKRNCNESARVLEKGGRLFIINIFSPIGRAKVWGDGISPINLKYLLKENFYKINFVNYFQKKKESINEYGYNITAVRK